MKEKTIYRLVRCLTTSAIIALFFIFFNTRANGQGQGTFEIPPTTSAGANPFFDPATGITRCTINWILNTTLNSVSLMFVDVFITGTAVCLNNEAGPNPTIIHPGFLPANFNRAFNSNQLTITRVGTINMPNPRPYANPPNTPFIVLQFRALPGVPYSININGWVNNPGTIITAASTTSTPPGMNVVGTLTKPLPSHSCDNGFGLGNSIPNVTVTKTATLPGVCFPGPVSEFDFAIAGFYQFNNSLTNTDYRVRPSKDNSTDMCCGIAGDDVTDFLTSWILDPGSMKNKEALSADFTGDGWVSSIDKAQILRCANGLPPLMEYFVPGWVPWRFAPLVTFPPDALVTVLPGNLIPDFINIPPSPGGTINNSSFWGVKRGDINHTCADCGSSVVSDVPTDRSVVQGGMTEMVDIWVEDQAFFAGQEVLIPIKTKGFQDVSDVILELILDPSAFDVHEIQEGFLPEKYPVSGVVNKPNEIAARFGWFSETMPGADIPYNAILFYIKATAKKDLASIKNSIWILPNTDRNILATQEEKKRLKFNFFIEPSSHHDFSVSLNSANPTTENTSLLVNLPSSSEIQITIIDGTGNINGLYKVELPSGVSEVKVLGLPTQSGIYSVLVQSKFGKHSLKLIKI